MKIGFLSRVICAIYCRTPNFGFARHNLFSWLMLVIVNWLEVLLLCFTYLTTAGALPCAAILRFMFLRSESHLPFIVSLVIRVDLHSTGERTMNRITKWPKQLWVRTVSEERWVTAMYKVMHYHHATYEKETNK